MKILEKIKFKTYEKDILIFLSIAFISFLNAWNFKDLFAERGLDILNPFATYNYIFLSRFLSYALTQAILFITDSPVLVYWAFYLIQMLFFASMIYISYKLPLNRLMTYIFLLVMPLFRYGEWDMGWWYGDTLAFLVIAWTYYFYKTGNRKYYIIFSIIGFFTREFCLYTNLFFIIDDFVLKGDTFKATVVNTVKNLKIQMKKMFKTHLFEIILILIFLPYRIIFGFLENPQIFTFGFLNPNRRAFEIQMFAIIFSFFSFMWYYILTKPRTEIILLILAVLPLSILIGSIWEINKIGCLAIVIFFEYFTKKDIVKPIENNEKD